MNIWTRTSLWLFWPTIILSMLGFTIASLICLAMQAFFFILGYLEGK